MSGLSVHGRRMMGLGLLVSGLVSMHPGGAAAEGKPAKSATARVTPKAPRDEARRADAHPPPARCVHIVRRADTLSRIAALHRVTRQSIIAANHLANADALRVGQRLRIAGCRAVAGRHGTDRGLASVPPDRGTLVARVGPRCIPTPLFLAVPEWRGEAGHFQWPIEGPVLSGFGQRPRGWHAGVDIKGEAGAPIRAAAAGTVLVSGWDSSYGNIVKITHPGGFISIYAHNHENLVDVGKEVRRGAVIATVGRSGRASAHHLHFEIRRAGTAYNPLHLLEPRDGPVLASAPGAPPHDDGPLE